MFDPITKTSKRITLDWDFSQFSQLRKYLKYILTEIQKDYPFKKLKVWTSPSKGFHVEIFFKDPVNIAFMRNILKDDGTRLLMDIMQPRTQHDILWSYKTINGIRTLEKELVFEFDGYTKLSNIFDTIPTSEKKDYVIHMLNKAYIENGLNV